MQRNHLLLFDSAEPEGGHLLSINKVAAKKHLTPKAVSLLEQSNLLYPKVC